MNWQEPRDCIRSIELMLLDGPRPLHEIVEEARHGGRTAAYIVDVVRELIAADRLLSFSEELPPGRGPKAVRLVRLTEWNLDELRAEIKAAGQ